MNEDKKIYTVHHVLAHSYTVFFVAVLTGFLADMLYPIRLIPGNLNNLGLIFMILGPALMFWAQYTSHKLSKVANKTYEHFRNGPYRFTRNPTHLGLTLMVLGLGVLMNSIFIIGFTIVAFIISRSIFLKEQERMLGESHGEGYIKYKNSLKI